MKILSWMTHSELPTKNSKSVSFFLKALPKIIGLEELEGLVDTYRTKKYNEDLIYFEKIGGITYISQTHFLTYNSICRSIGTGR